MANRTSDAPPPKAETRPATQGEKDGPPTVASTTHKRTSGDKDVDAMLDRLETKGEAIKGLSCKLIHRYVIVDPVEETVIKKGRLLFKKAADGRANSMFFVEFSEKIADGVKTRNLETFSFDGHWLTELNAKSRTVTLREIVRPGETIDPFEIGKGPFPMPFGQKRDEILRNFRVSRVALEVGDPPGSMHLHCVPRPGTGMAAKYSRVDIYVNRKFDLPVRMVTENVKDGTRIEVDFVDIDASAAPAGSRFVITPPPGYDVRKEPLPPATTGKTARKGKP